MPDKLNVIARSSGIKLTCGNVRAVSEETPVAYLYTLEYGNTTVNRKVSEWRLNYPFGVCGADYLRSNDDGMSYIRETPLYTLKGIK